MLPGIQHSRLVQASQRTPSQGLPAVSLLFQHAAAVSPHHLRASALLLPASVARHSMTLGLPTARAQLIRSTPYMQA